MGRAAGLLLDVLNPELAVITEQSSLLNPEYLEEIRAAATGHSLAAATVLLNPLFRSPLQALGDATP